MITLKDYIGKIYKEVTNAKVQSDIETLAIAQEYVANPMLKHFSVPNIRIKNMELTIPVAVDKTETVTRDYTEKEIQTVYEQAFVTVNDELLTDLSEEKVSYLQSIQPEVSNKAQMQSVDVASNLQQATVADSQTATQQPVGEEATGAESTSSQYAATLNLAASQFADVSFGFVAEFNVDQAAYRTAIIQEVESNLQPRLPEIEDLPVIVETERLKQINDPANLISIKVNITDDAMEWTTDIDENGNTVQRLDYQ
ncbi:hypothetical protein KORDIASMS9_01515 [Kordia sp. SMS9]|uniref:hypothetical protein n=1 Tax=Kordia sp. SMS9 TaxID=2282170 RepID=UPI000E0CDB77|nr:hypothetical protein [Kordia sp. SMS9]AXG69295.1 hypothetical protein KORDIASMS9_01515 [Kordia sp. SMS9]